LNHIYRNKSRALENDKLTHPFTALPACP